MLHIGFKHIGPGGRRLVLFRDIVEHIWHNYPRSAASRGCPRSRGRQNLAAPAHSLVLRFPVSTINALAASQIGQSRKSRSVRAAWTRSSRAMSPSSTASVLSPYASACRWC
jgi:hypothetical protein